MSKTITMECSCCGNRNAKSFKPRKNGYVCGCCGVAFYLENDKNVNSDEKNRVESGYLSLRNYEFSKARYTFADVIRDYPESIDARWGLLLAKYGVVFIKGFFDGEVEPIYCFPEYDELNNQMFRSESEYGEILDLIGDDKELLDFFEEKSRKIDTAIRKFRECKNNVERDVFICVKISAATERNPSAQGQTEDYALAQKIYNELRAKGMNVFFSFVTLHNEINSDHEIWLNLVKSKKLLLIGSNEEYIESAWVKSEWKRWMFLDRYKDMYIFSMRHSHESPKSILPHELRATQIYTFDTYDKLISDISGETDAAEAEQKKREAAEQERRKREAEKAERKKREAEEAERKKRDAEAAEKKRREREERASERREAIKEHAPTIIKWGLIIAAVLTVALCSIFIEATRAWFIAIGIGAAYAVFWNVIRRKTEFDYVPWYIFTNVCLSIACIPLYCISETTRAYALGFALAVLSSAIGLLVKCWQDKTVEKSSDYNYYTRSTVYTSTYSFKFNPREYISTFYFTLIGGILFSIAVGCLFSGFAMALVIGCGIALVYITMTVLTTFLYCDGDTEAAFFAFNIILGIVGFIFVSLAYSTDVNFAVCALGVLGAAVLSAVIMAIRRDQGISWSIVGVGAVIIVFAIVALFEGSNSASNTFNIEDGVLVSYGGTEEVVVIPEEVIAIGDNAFNHDGPHKNMKEIVLHDGITSIGENAFKNCDVLTSITIPSGVSAISSYAFAECDKLASVTFNEGLVEIKSEAFDNCDSLTSITLPESLRRLGDYCFSDCNKLTSIYINSGINYLGTGLFSNGDIYITIYYGGSESQWNSIETSWIPWTYLIEDYEVVYGS